MLILTNVCIAADRDNISFGVCDCLPIWLQMTVFPKYNKLALYSVQFFERTENNVLLLVNLIF